MTELKQKAEEWIEEYTKDKGTTTYSHWELSEMLFKFATEVTKELQEENKCLVNDYEMIHNCFLIKENEVKKLEKQIEELTEQNTSLFTSVENPNKSVQELEGQVTRAFEVLEGKRKRIEELEDKLANAEYQLEGRDNEIKELETESKKIAENTFKLIEENSIYAKQIKDLETRLEAQKETIASYDADLNKAKAQIEKMKCCNNCKHRCYMDWKSKCCFDMTEIRDIENPITCKCNKWEIEG